MVESNPVKLETRQPVILPLQSNQSFVPAFLLHKAMLGEIQTWDQCDHIWRNFATLAKCFWQFFRVNLIFGIILNLLWLKFYDNSQNFLVENDKI